MGDAGDVRLAVGAVFVAHGDVADAQAHERRAEEEIEIPEGVEVAEFWQAFQQPFVVGARHHLGAAEAVLDALAEDKTERVGEEVVAEHVEEAHGLVLHRVNQAAAIGELGGAGAQDLKKFRQVFRRRGQVAVLDDKHVAGGVLEAMAHGVPLAFARLPGEFELQWAFIFGNGFLQNFPSFVFAVALNEDNFRLAPEHRNARKRGGDVAFLIAHGHDDGEASLRGFTETNLGPGDEEDRHAQRLDKWQAHQEAVEESVQHWNIEREKLFAAGENDFPTGEFEEVGEVATRQPVPIITLHDCAGARPGLDERIPDVVERSDI